MTPKPADQIVPDPLLRRAARDAGSGAPGPRCITAEAAAAWADRSLPAGESAAVASHAAGCGRCRALLAAIAHTEPAASPRRPWWSAGIVRWGAPLAAVTAAGLVWINVARQPERPEVARVTLEAPAREVIAGAEPSPSTPPASAAPPVAPDSSGRRERFEARKEKSVDRRADAARETPAPMMDAAPSPRQQQAAKPSAAATPPPIQESVESRAASPVFARRTSPEIVSPDGSARWRLGTPGVIERSTDAGRTWERQPIDTTPRLLAGAAPSATVAWVAGAAGTVLRTTDGRTWQRRTSPDPADLVAVTAIDARTATVTTADGRIFRTTDGGVTWTQVHHP